VLGQTFRAINHSRMRVVMERYRAQNPDARLVLFEPGREDADMFFANIFSYWQRKRLCAVAFATTRRSLAQRAAELAPTLDRHGVTIRQDRLAMAERRIADALTDPRPLRAHPHKLTVKRAARDLSHTLDHLERAVAAAR
jgi:hypothetical protein